jgi:hypothetical protein
MWEDVMPSECQAPDVPDAAFLAFCKKKAGPDDGARARHEAGTVGGHAEP